MALTIAKKLYNAGLTPARAPDAGFAWLWEEAYDAELDAMVAEYTSGAYPAQPWPVLPATEVEQIWCEFSDTGDVADHAKLDTLRELTLRNIVRLQINIELAGHTPRPPKDVVENHDIPDVDAFTDWAISTEEGAMRISDYAMPKLLDLAAKLKTATTAGRKVMYLDGVLHTAHQRSELSGWFIEGGLATLNRLAND